LAGADISGTFEDFSLPVEMTTRIYMNCRWQIFIKLMTLSTKWLRRNISRCRSQGQTFLTLCDAIRNRFQYEQERERKVDFL